MKKLTNLATGVRVELEEGKKIIMDGPSSKLDHLTMVMQQMVNMYTHDCIEYQFLKKMHIFV